MGYRWILKAATQGLVSRMPFGDAANTWMQFHVTHSLPMKPPSFSRRLERAADHIDHFQTHGGGIPARVVELGTGWHPVIPIALALCGVQQVYAVDIHDLTSDRLLRHTLEQFRSIGFDRLKALQPCADERRYDRLLSLDGAPLAVLNALGVTLITADARRLDLAANSIDGFTSNMTLEHIPGDVIAGIYREFHRIGTPGALMSHNIDMSDHYSHLDHTITSYNFLRFGDAAWSVINNRLLYQNRLRLSDHLALTQQADWRVVDTVRRANNATQLPRVPLAKRFRSYARADLEVTGAWIISRKDS